MWWCRRHNHQLSPPVVPSTMNTSSGCLFGATSSTSCNSDKVIPVHTLIEHHRGVSPRTTGLLSQALHWKGLLYYAWLLKPLTCTFHTASIWEMLSQYWLWKYKKELVDWFQITFFHMVIMAIWVMRALNSNWTQLSTFALQTFYFFKVKVCKCMSLYVILNTCSEKVIISLNSPIHFLLFELLSPLLNWPQLYSACVCCFMDLNLGKRRVTTG